MMFGDPTRPNPSSLFGVSDLSISNFNQPSKSEVTAFSREAYYFGLEQRWYSRERQEERAWRMAATESHPSRQGTVGWVLTKLFDHWRDDYISSTPFARLLKEMAPDALGHSIARPHGGNDLAQVTQSEDVRDLMSLSTALTKMGQFHGRIAGNRELEGWVQEELGLTLGFIRQSNVIKNWRGDTAHYSELTRLLIQSYSAFSDAVNLELLRSASATNPKAGLHAHTLSPISFAINSSFFRGMLREVAQGEIEISKIANLTYPLSQTVLVRDRLESKKLEPFFDKLLAFRFFIQELHPLIIERELESFRSIGLKELATLPQLPDDDKELFPVLPAGLVVVAKELADGRFVYGAFDGLLEYSVIGLQDTTKFPGICAPRMTHHQEQVTSDNLMGVIGSSFFTKNLDGRWILGPNRGPLLVDDFKDIPAEIVADVGDPKKVLDRTLHSLRIELDRLWEQLPALFGCLPDVSPLIFVKSLDGTLGLYFPKSKKDFIIETWESFNFPTKSMPAPEARGEPNRQGMRPQFLCLAPFELSYARFEFELSTEEAAVSTELPLAADIHEPLTLRQVLQNHCQSARDFLRVLSKLGVEHDLSRGAGSHSLLIRDEWAYPVSRRFRDGAFPLEARHVRSTLKALRIDESDFISLF